MKQLFFLSVIFLSISAQGQKDLKSPKINIEIPSGKLFINEIELKKLEINSIIEVLGKPDRIINDTTEFRNFTTDSNGGFKDGLSYIINKHFIYDNIGLIFITKKHQPSDTDSLTVSMYIPYEHWKKVMNGDDYLRKTNTPKFVLKNYFKGTFLINGQKPNSSLGEFIVRTKNETIETYIFNDSNGNLSWINIFKH